MSDKTILCAIDFSESSLQAVKWTLGLAKLTRAKIVVMFCYRLIATDGDKESVDLRKNMEDEALRKFGEIENGLIHGQSVSYQFVTEVGFFPFRIEMFLRKTPVGLLVIGNSIVHSFNEYKDFNFEQFLKSSKVPIVVVPEETKDALKPMDIIEFSTTK